MKHVFSNGKCEWCDCHAWEGSKPCRKRAKQAKQTDKAISQGKRYADELPERDYYVGDSPDY